MADERLQKTFKFMSAQKQDWRDVVIPRGTRTRSITYKVHALLQQDYVWRLCELVIPNDIKHYIHSDMFKISCLYANLFSPYGGLLVFLALVMEQRLRLCFNTVEWDIEDMNNALRTLDSPLTSDVAETACATRWVRTKSTELSKATPMLTAITDDIRTQIDDAFVKHLSPGGVREHFGQDTDAWKKGFSSYTNMVSEEIQRIVDEKSKSPEWDAVPDDVKECYKSCAAKMKFVLMLRGQSKFMTFYRFPFMSYHVWDALVIIFKQVPNSLKEVSSWYSPLTYQKKTVAKEWAFGSESADLIRALCAHPDIDPALLPRVVDTTVYSIVMLYPALLKMEGQLSNIPTPLRFTTTTMLNEYFMSAEEKEKTKMKTKKKDKTNDSNEEDSGNDHDIDEELEVEKELERFADSSEAHRSALREERDALLQLLTDALRSLSSTSRAKGSKGKEKAKTDGVLASTWGNAWRRELSEDLTRYKQSKRNLSLFRSLPLILYHTLDWGTIITNNQARRRREVVHAAIHEHCVLLGYRTALLADTRGSAATIRACLERSVAFGLNAGWGTKSVVDGKKTYLLTWPDGIVYDGVSAAKNNIGFDVDKEVRKATHRSTIVGQKKSAWSLFSFIQNFPLARAPEAFLDDECKKKPIADKVADAFYDLLQALDRNAFLQRNRDADPDDLKLNGVPAGESVVADVVRAVVSSRFLTATSPMIEESQSTSKGEEKDGDDDKMPMPPLFPHNENSAFLQKEIAIRATWRTAYNAGQGYEIIQG